jgi:quercetin dioxygenase-like cupin family protein
MAVQLEAEHKRLDAPDETRAFPKGRNEIVTVGGIAIGRLTFEPGWHWAEHVKPMVGTASCQVAHGLYVISGQLRTRLDSGEEFDMVAGEAGYVPPGHDGWVIGNEPFVAIDILGAVDYAKPR